MIIKYHCFIFKPYLIAGVVFGLWDEFGKITKNIDFLHSGVQSKNNVYHIVDKVQNSYENALKFDLIDNVVYVVLALYSSHWSVYDKN